MNVLFLSFLLFLGLVYCKPNIAPRIIQGKTALAGQFPFQAAVIIDTAVGEYFCGGTLVSRQHVLTAAHCCASAREFTIHLGITKLNNANGVTVATATADIHPDYNPDTLENDLCLIHLHLPISYTQYLHPIIVIPDTQVYIGEVVTVAGWGQVSDSTAGESNDLLYVDVVVISNDECKITYGDQIKENMLCTQGNYNEGICVGDTGGPLVLETTFGNAYLLGVAGFFSQQGCETLHPSGFTNIKTYVPWIENITQFD